MPAAHAGPPVPATVVMRRRARPGCEQRLRDWAEALCADAATMPGHVASRVFRSPVDPGGQLVLGVTFACPADLLAWNDSAPRAARLSRVEDLTEGPALAVGVDMPASTGATSNASAGPPTVPRWLSALLVWVAIYPSALLIGAVTGPVLDATPLWIDTFVTTALLVPFVLFVAVPALHRLLRPWLRRRAS